MRKLRKLAKLQMYIHIFKPNKKHAKDIQISDPAIVCFSKLHFTTSIVYYRRITVE